MEFSGGHGWPRALSYTQKDGPFKKAKGERILHRGGKNLKKLILFAQYLFTEGKRYYTLPWEGVNIFMPSERNPPLSLVGLKKSDKSLKLDFSGTF